MKTKISIITLSLLAVLTLAACGGTTAGVNPPNVRSINVTGTGEVYLTPDVAYVNVGVQNQGPTVTDVLDQNTAQAQGIRYACRMNWVWKTRIFRHPVSMSIRTTPTIPTV